MDFNAAAEKVKTLKSSPTNDQKLKVYSLYKQGTVGNVNIAQPWAVQMEARAKWDAWKSVEGMTKEDAQAQYVKLVEELIQQYGLQ